MARQTTSIPTKQITKANNSMIFWICEDALYRGAKVHIQDTNALASSALVGIPDKNQIVWDTYWVPFKELSKIHRD